MMLCDAAVMEDYLIGAGALLQAGQNASAALATLHAQTEPALAAHITAALVDFEGSQLDDRSRLVIVASGFTPARFNERVVVPLLAQGDCTLVDVLASLAQASGAPEVHVFARWLPDESIAASLAARGVGLVAHPLDSIAHAALVVGTTYRRWSSPLRAA